MSRIHEALKRAEEQRPPSWKPAEPTPLRFGGERLAPGVLQPSLQQEMPTARRCLGLVPAWFERLSQWASGRVFHHPSRP